MIGERPWDNRDSQVGPSGGLLAFFAHRAPTWLEGEPLQCYLIQDHGDCVANVGYT